MVSQSSCHCPAMTLSDASKILQDLYNILNAGKLARSCQDLDRDFNKPLLNQKIENLKGKNHT